MKYILIAATIAMTVGMLSACTESSADTPSLGSERPATGRVPSPGNISATQLNTSNRMSPVTQ